MEASDAEVAIVAIRADADVQMSAHRMEENIVRAEVDQEIGVAQAEALAEAAKAPHEEGSLEWQVSRLTEQMGDLTAKLDTALTNLSPTPLLPISSQELAEAVTEAAETLTETEPSLTPLSTSDESDLTMTELIEESVSGEPGLPPLLEATVQGKRVPLIKLV
jgi:hypothetical protein